MRQQGIGTEGVTSSKKDRMARDRADALLWLYFLAILTPMEVSIAEAKNRLPELVRAMEAGESVVITRHGKPVARLEPPPAQRRQIRLGTMRDRIKLLPGWDDAVTDEDLLGRRR
jgi:prevent-host-death family protein